MIIEKFVVGVVRTNCYLVYKEDIKKAVLIDPGKGYNKISDYCLQNNIKVEAVLLTHGHFDHILEASLWQNTGAKVYIHNLDADKLHSEKNMAHMVGAKVSPFDADILLSGEETLEIGGLSIKVMHTPGHSAGSVSYIIEDCIFSGDTLFSGDHGRVDFVDGSLSDIINSIKRLFNLKGDYNVYPGHDEETTLSKERKSNIALRYM